MTPSSNQKKNMIARSLSVLALIATALVLVHCGGDDDPPNPPVVEPTPEETVRGFLTNDGTTATWSPASTTSGIVVDGIDVTEQLFPGFSLTFNNNGTLTTAGTTPVWLR